MHSILIDGERLNKLFSAPSGKTERGSYLLEDIALINAYVGNLKTQMETRLWHGK